MSASGDFQATCYSLAAASDKLTRGRQALEHFVSCFVSCVPRILFSYSNSIRDVSCNSRLYFIFYLLLLYGVHKHIVSVSLTVFVCLFVHHYMLHQFSLFTVSVCFACALFFSPCGQYCLFSIGHVLIYFLVFASLTICRL